jgi:alpha-1,6-mannosyltransferase
VEALGQAARVKAVEQFAWNRVFEDLTMLYGELTGKAEFVTPQEALPIN